MTLSSREYFSTFRRIIVFPFQGQIVFSDSLFLNINALCFISVHSRSTSIYVVDQHMRTGKICLLHIIYYVHVSIAVATIVW